MKRSELVSVVIPVFNESVHLEEMIQRCRVACGSMGRPFELIFVDDGSSDHSVAIVEEAALIHPEVRGVVLNRNYGQHAAVLAGFEAAQGDSIVTLDADLQNPPEEIPRLVAKLEEGYDVVGSVRSNREDSMFRRLASRLINRMVQRSTGVMMTDYGCMLRAYRRKIVDAMLRCSERTTFIPVLANSFARKTTEIPVEHSARTEGKSKYGFWKLIQLQFDLLTSMTTFPLRMLSVLGGIISLLGVSFGVLLMVLRVVYGSEWAEGGVFTLFAILFTFIGAQFLAMGLLGEYIGRIYHDVRARPRSFVERMIQHDRPREARRAIHAIEISEKS